MSLFTFVICTKRLSLLQLPALSCALSYLPWLVLPCAVLSCFVVSCVIAVFCDAIFCYAALTCLVFLSCLVLPRLVFPGLVLSCLVLSHVFAACFVSVFSHCLVFLVCLFSLPCFVLGSPVLLLPYFCPARLSLLPPTFNFVSRSALTIWTPTLSLSNRISLSLCLFVLVCLLVSLALLVICSHLPLHCLF